MAERGVYDRMGGKIVKTWELMVFVPNDFIDGGLSVGAGGFCFLQVVYQFEEVIPGGLQPVGVSVGDTTKFDGVVVESFADFPVADGADLDSAGGLLELFRSVGIGKGGCGNAEEDQLGAVVSVVVQVCFDPGGRAFFTAGGEQPVADPIEDED